MGYPSRALESKLPAAACLIVIGTEGLASRQPDMHAAGKGDHRPARSNTDNFFKRDQRRRRSTEVMTSIRFIMLRPSLGIDTVSQWRSNHPGPVPPQGGRPCHGRLDGDPACRGRAADGLVPPQACSRPDLPFRPRQPICQQLLRRGDRGIQDARLDAPQRRRPKQRDRRDASARCNSRRNGLPEQQPRPHEGFSLQTLDGSKVRHPKIGISPKFKLLKSYRSNVPDFMKQAATTTRRGHSALLGVAPRKEQHHANQSRTQKDQLGMRADIFNLQNICQD